MKKQDLMKLAIMGIVAGSFVSQSCGGHKTAPQQSTQTQPQPQPENTCRGLKQEPTSGYSQGTSPSTATPPPKTQPAKQTVADGCGTKSDPNACSGGDSEDHAAEKAQTSLMKAKRSFRQ